ncbi:hypothetical protein Tco_1575540 [Tanacetum coccineum]
MENANSPSESPNSFLRSMVLRLHSRMEVLTLESLSPYRMVIQEDQGDGVARVFQVYKVSDDFSETEEDSIGSDKNKVESVEELGFNYFDRFPTSEELAYHIIGHLYFKNVYIDLESPMNIMTREVYNNVIKEKLKPRIHLDDPRRVRNFTGKVKGIHVTVGNFTYRTEFLVIEDIGSLIDHSLSNVVLGKPFVNESHMSHDQSLGRVRFTDGVDEITYQMPHMMDQFSALLNFKKDHVNPIYVRNEEDKIKGAEYVKNKIAGFYTSAFN